MKIPVSLSHSNGSTFIAPDVLSDGVDLRDRTRSNHGVDFLSVFTKHVDKAEHRLLRILVSDTPAIRPLLVEFLEGESFTIEIAVEKSTHC